eukprot:m.60218 g.60218  ORF g.60218 m.60218 type:complete len:527 (+) comp13845_c0_seq1:177-1757(+)
MSFRWLLFACFQLAPAELTAQETIFRFANLSSFLNAHQAGESYDFAYAAIHTTNDIQTFNKRLGNALLTLQDTTNTIYGLRLAPSQHTRNLKQLILYGTPVLSQEGIERVTALARLGWIRLNKGSNMPRALSWRLKQLQSAQSQSPSSQFPSTSTLYFASMPTQATLQLLARLKAQYPDPRSAPLVFSASATVFFPYGMFHLPAPFELCHRPMLRVGGMALEHDIQMPHFSHVLPAGPSSLRDQDGLFSATGRINLLAFVGSVEGDLFQHHLKLARYALVEGLLRLEQKHMQASFSPGLYQHLFATPLLNHTGVNHLVSSRYNDKVTHRDYDQLSTRKLSLTLSLYASSHFVLSVAGDVNLRQSIYDAWYMGAIPVVHEPSLASLQVMYGGHLFPTLDDVRAVVLAVPAEASASLVATVLEQAVQSGLADTMRAAVRAMVDHVVYRADTAKPDALSWGLGVLAWRDTAQRQGETVKYPAIPNDHLWPTLTSCKCERHGRGMRTMKACVTQYCYEAKSWFNETCTEW